MRKLGISIYPEKSQIEEMKSYIDFAAECQFSRVFSSLLQLDGDIDEITDKFRTINKYAKDQGFEVIVDVAPRIFEALDISYRDLKFFAEIHADGLRLDVGFTGSEEAMMTYNPYNLKIELNMSNNVHTIDTIMDYQPNQYNLYACHNFYPHNYSGLGIDFFKECSRRFKKYGLRTAAFITSQNSDTFGPWPVTEGLPTIEDHRHLPMDVQVKHMIAINMVDDIIISNCYPSQNEMLSVQKLDLSLVTFDVELIDNLPEVETSIVLDELHFNRGDHSENLIRSTQSRVKYKGHHFDLFNVPDQINKGDLIIESSEYGHYAGELQIALKTMKNSGKSNVVGKVRECELFILDELKPWQKFKFRRSN